MALPVAATTNGNLPTNPFSLGIVTPTAAGTALKLTHNFTDLDNRTMKWLNFRGLDTNRGVVYVIVSSVLVQPVPPVFTLPGGGSTNGADTTTYLNVVQVLSPGESWSVPTEMMNMLRLGQFYIDVATTGDSAIACAYEA